MGKTKPGQRVMLAPTRKGDHAQTVWVDDQGRAKLDADWWMVIRYEQQIAVLLGAPRGRSWEIVLSRLNLSGYWPTRSAMSGYMDGYA